MLLVTLSAVGVLAFAGVFVVIGGKAGELDTAK
jgi:hypothetical protein